jgi:hypothetical protein
MCIVPCAVWAPYVSLSIQDFDVFRAAACVAEASGHGWQSEHLSQPQIGLWKVPVTAADLPGITPCHFNGISLIPEPPATLYLCHWEWRAAERIFAETSSTVGKRLDPVIRCSASLFKSACARNLPSFLEEYAGTRVLGSSSSPQVHGLRLPYGLELDSPCMAMLADYVPAFRIVSAIPPKEGRTELLAAEGFAPESSCTSSEDDLSDNDETISSASHPLRSSTNDTNALRDCGELVTYPPIKVADIRNLLQRFKASQCTRSDGKVGGVPPSPPIGEDPCSADAGADTRRVELPPKREYRKTGSFCCADAGSVAFKRLRLLSMGGNCL